LTYGLDKKIIQITKQKFSPLRPLQTMPLHGCCRALNTFQYEDNSRLFNRDAFKSLEAKLKKTLWPKTLTSTFCPKTYTCTMHIWKLIISSISYRRYCFFNLIYKFKKISCYCYISLNGISSIFMLLEEKKQTCCNLFMERRPKTNSDTRLKQVRSVFILSNDFFHFLFNQPIFQTTCSGDW